MSDYTKFFHADRIMTAKGILDKYPTHTLREKFQGQNGTVIKEVGQHCPPLYEVQLDGFDRTNLFYSTQMFHA